MGGQTTTTSSNRILQGAPAKSLSACLFAHRMRNSPAAARECWDFPRIGVRRGAGQPEIVDGHHWDDGSHHWCGVLLRWTSPHLTDAARRCSSMAELLLPKQIARVRFPSSALVNYLIIRTKARSAVPIPPCVDPGPVVRCHTDRCDCRVRVPDARADRRARDTRPLSEHRPAHGDHVGFAPPHGEDVVVDESLEEENGSGGPHGVSV